jgi:hypothetical protein
MLTIKEVHSAHDVKEFIEFPLRLYKKCPHFVPPLYGDEKKLLKSGGCSDIAKSVFYLAIEDGRTIGRIQGVIQKQYNEIHNTLQSRFTRFDAINDQRVADALLSAVEKWSIEQGMTEICGPLGFNDLDREGLLVDGFEDNSTFEEQYNYAYYSELLEKKGYLERRKDPEDGRSRILILTEKAKRLQKELEMLGDRLEADFTCSLSNDEKDVLKQLLLKLLNEESFNNLISN